MLLLLPLRHFVWTPTFERTASGVLAEDDVLRMEATLRKNPEAGRTEDNAGGARKVRVALAGRGKRGGARVLYFYAKDRDTVYLLLAFAKNVQAKLTEEQKRALRTLVARLQR